ncbi:sulfate transporter family protein [Aurantimonas sp. VKM B-3413]|uniref:sulfate transporter family protein n=1 Tax=Aurantimonas sp. VKM B-3413 TaxID=2779401 RepID=UPI001E4C2660|nr:sulfate transporter family protein [Aurantimonas sp. VKM B-3413]MCB8838034.1 sulfate transporter family protein [Aurantimonas sp. VKM B-3413]
MILASARLALADILSPPFRAVLWKTLGLTLLVLIGLWFGVEWGFEWLAVPFLANLFPESPNWLMEAGTLAGWAAGLALAILLAFLIAPISALIAGLFQDDVAEIVEREAYPGAPRGRAMPFFAGMVLSLKFLGVVILGNLLAFALLLVPGVNFAAFFLVNGYLLGREYFEFAAMRYRGETEAKALRIRYGTTVFLAGLVIAAFLAVPILNLLTPLFAASLMVHLHQRVAKKEGGLVEREAEAPRVARG